MTVPKHQSGDEPADKRPAKVNAAAIIALCAGIASFIVEPYLVGTAAIIAGIVGCAKAREAGEEPPREGMAVSGIALGVLGIATTLFVRFIVPYSHLF